MGKAVLNKVTVQEYKRIERLIQNVGTVYILRRRGNYNTGRVSVGESSKKYSCYFPIELKDFLPPTLFISLAIWVGTVLLNKTSNKGSVSSRR